MTAPTANGGQPKVNQGTQLVKIAEDRYGFGLSPEGQAFAYSLDAQHVALPLKGNQLGLRQRLASDFYDKHGSAVSQTALASAMNVIEGKALNETPTTLHMRVAGNRDSIYIDMADKANRVIRIGGGKWEIVTECPYTFRRSTNTAELPEPRSVKKVRASLYKWFKYIHVAEEDRWLLIGSAVDALINPNTAKPIVHFEGEHGVAKTGSTVSLASVIDPTSMPHNSPPKSLLDWAATANSSWVVALDNLSSMPDWLSDALCRTATGTGIANRALYTDGDLSIFKFRRLIVMNGISLDRMRGDLADRLIAFTLRAIPDEERLTEEDIKASWSQDRPEILGALLTVAAKVQKHLPLLEPMPLPRMADFARVLACIDQLAGTESLATYRSRLVRALAESITDNFILFLMEKRYSTAQANSARDQRQTASEILDGAKAMYRASPKPKDWPAVPRSVTSQLRRNAPALRTKGWTIEEDAGKNKEKAVRWLIVPPALDEEMP